MPTESTYPTFDIPNLDLWAFLLERKDKPYPDSRGQILLQHLRKHPNDKKQSSSAMPTPIEPTPMRISNKQPLILGQVLKLNGIGRRAMFLRFSRLTISTLLLSCGDAIGLEES